MKPRIAAPELVFFSLLLAGCAARANSASPAPRSDFSDQVSAALQGNPACTQILEADYSCSALLHDPLYGLIQNRMANPRCEDARGALREFDRTVEDVRLQIQWYQNLTSRGD